MTTSDDFEVVRTVLSGDREAYATLVRAYQGRVIRICQILLSNPVEAEDAAQDVFVKVYQSLSDFRGRSSFSTWVYRISHNHCMDLLRKKSRQKTDSWDDLLEKNQEKASELMFDKRESGVTDEDRELLKEVLSSLRPEYKEILVLREVMGFSYEEITSILRCSLDAVKARLRRAREELREKSRHFLGAKVV